MTLQRAVKTTTFALTTSAATTAAIGNEGFAGGTVQIPTGSSITSLTYYGSDSQTGTYTALYDAEGAAVTQTSLTAARTYEIPDACFAVAWLKIVGDAAGNVVVTQKT